MRRSGTIQRNAVRLVAVIIVLTLYGFARLPETSLDERAELAARFHFTPTALPILANYPARRVRPVNLSLAHISAWISSGGAGAALGDLDKDGLANDICHVDPRIDQVIISPTPGSGARYPAFALSPNRVHYDYATMAPMGCLIGDLNEDSLPDLLVYYWGRTPLAFLRLASTSTTLNNDHYAAYDIVPGAERWYTNAATLADIDGDGHADLIIGNYFPDGSRILDARADQREVMQDSMSRAYNGGDKHFLLWAAGGAPGEVRYTEAKGVLDDIVNHTWTLAMGAADLDGDMLPELYFANDYGPDRLLHNRSTPGQLRFALLEGRKTLTTPSSKVLGKDSFKGMGVDFADLNSDGVPDIYVSNITAEYALEESNFTFVSTGGPETARESMRRGIAPYVDRSEALGLSRSNWAWDAKLADLDNDGVYEALQATGFVKGEVNRWPELQELGLGNDELVHKPGAWPRVQPGDDISGHTVNPFFVRGVDGRYVDVSHELGLDQPQVSRGIAIADVDGDGRLDFIFANQWETSYFYRNDCPNCGAFLGLHLRLPLERSTGTLTSATVREGHPAGDTSDRPAISATAKIYLPDGETLTAQVDGGNGHSGKRSPDLHFGLGHIAPNTRLRVDLSWRDPGGQVQRETLNLTPGWHTVGLVWPHKV